MSRTVRAVIEGPEAELGRIAAADVARLIIGLERAIARAAYVVLGRQRPRTGRHQAAIEQAARLRFVGVDRGSFVELLALPEGDAPGDDELPMPVETLGHLAFDRLLGALRDEHEDVDRELAAAVAQLADDLGVGDRAERLTLQSGQDAPAVIDAAVRIRMRRIATGRPDARTETLVGTLVEADFERLTARLQPPVGPSVTVRFSPELSDSIQEALRQLATLQGLVSYDPRNSVATSLQLRSLNRGQQLAIELGDFGTFWHPATLDDLMRAQGIAEPVDLDSLYDNDLSDDERDRLSAFLANE